MLAAIFLDHLLLSTNMHKADTVSTVVTRKDLSIALSKIGRPHFAVPLTQHRSIDTNLSQHRFSLPSPSFPSLALPRLPPTYSSSHSNDLPRPPSFSKDHSTISSHVENVLPTTTSFGREFPSWANPFVLSLTALLSTLLPQTIKNHGQNSSSL